MNHLQGIPMKAKQCPTKRAQMKGEVKDADELRIR